MNIFLSDTDPWEAAQALDSQRLVKMVLETAQLLSTAVHVEEHELAAQVYRPTHLHHPCTKWVISAAANYRWTLDHFAALTTEYTFRYGREHACNKLYPLFLSFLNDWDEGADADEIEYWTYHDGTRGTGAEITEKYRNYLAEKWNNDDRPKWNPRAEPSWRADHSERILATAEERPGTGT